MIFDTDVLIWTLRGNQRAARIVEQDVKRELSVVSYMELLEGVRDKKEAAYLRQFVQSFEILPLSAEIGQQGREFMEEYSLKIALGPIDALIAATAIERKMPLCTGNIKHYRMIHDLDLRGFRP